MNSSTITNCEKTKLWVCFTGPRGLPDSTLRTTDLSDKSGKFNNNNKKIENQKLRI